MQNEMNLATAEAATESTALVAQVQAHPATVLGDEKTYERFYQALINEVNNHKPDTTTAAGRKEIASLAYKVTRTKTAIDDAGKKLTEEARNQINMVNEQRRKVREDLEALAEKARKPLTDWEEAEKLRVETIKARLEHIQRVGQGFIGPDMQPFGLLFRELEEKVTLDVATFGEFLPEAQKLHALAKAALLEAQEKQRKEEAERAELERFRAEAAERARKEEEAKAAAAAKAKEEAAAAAAAEAARLERERIQREEQEKAAAAVREAQEREEAARREKEQAEAEAAARVKAAEEAAAAKVKAAEEEAARKAEAEAAEKRRLEAEAKAREADREHRGKLMGEAKQAIMGLGVEEETAKKLVLAIVAGEVPHVSLKF